MIAWLAIAPAGKFLRCSRALGHGGVWLFFRCLSARYAWRGLCGALAVAQWQRQSCAGMLGLVVIDDEACHRMRC